MQPENIPNLEGGQQRNRGEPTRPRLAATIILLRGGDAVLEVLLCRRTPKARFMGGAWVFPGGSVTADDGEGDAGLRAAAVREVAEEAGLQLTDPGALVPFSNWITPAEVKIRFDTHFFLAPAPGDQEPQIDGAEIVDSGWFTPAGALAASRAKEIDLVFPTIKQLEQLSAFATADELLAYARTREVLPVQPRIIGEGEMARIVLPGEPEYED